MGTWFLVSALATVGVIAHTTAQDGATVAQPARPIDAAHPVMRAPVRPALVTALDAHDAGSDDAGEDLGEVLVRADAHAREVVRSHNAIIGAMKDEHTGEPLAGVTILATSPAMPGAQAAISDATGTYAITGLPSGEYTVSFYYVDLTVERSHVWVTGSAATRLDQALDGEGSHRLHARSPEVILKTIPVPSRTFEEAFPDAGDDETSIIGCENTLENIYVTDDSTTR